MECPETGKLCHPQPSYATLFPMEIARRVSGSLKTVVKAVLLLALTLVGIATLVWGIQHWRELLGAAFLLGMVAYAFSPEGRRLLGDLHKW